MDVVTSDWSQFGAREIQMAKELLSHIKEIDTYGKVEVMFNRHSGYVFLSDENFDVWMMNGDQMEKWYVCGYCGHEGFLEDFKHEPQNQDCISYMQDAGIEIEEEALL